LYSLTDNQLQVACKEIYKLAELIMTIPSSAAIVERSFSAMKRIHTCCRGTNAGKVMPPKLTIILSMVLTQFPRQNRRLELVYK
jgi:hypothetical protein